MTRSSRLRLAGIGVAAALIALAGCGNDTPPFVVGTPDGVVVPAEASAGAGWAQDREGDLWVVTFGSSSNPRIATSATADGQTVTVTLAEAHPGKPATADFVASTSYVEVPEGVDSGSPVTVVLGDLGTAEIADLTTPGWVLPGS